MDIMLVDERARRQVAEEQPHARLDQLAETQDGLQSVVINMEHSLHSVQQQLQSVVEQLKQYNRNKSVLGEG
ncbi:UNVERIFIED_CONTAM: hypothetical protein Slati_3010600 [Sesamum latifolium]|uniref:Uncharacterized protein n=1 Tax=Sesamum latifolium TaxID=2727402 RepID=A0AAW2VGS5_9LAMI